MTMTTDRQSGRTTTQILEAPPNAIFVWCNSDLSYPAALCKKLNRTDIKIVSTSSVEYVLIGYPRIVVVDHYTEMPERLQKLIEIHNGIMRNR